jgi:hypothetical protein
MPLGLSLSVSERDHLVCHDTASEIALRIPRTINDKVEQADAANRHPFGTSGMPPANPASRAGDTPEAGGDS